MFLNSFFGLVKCLEQKKREEKTIEKSFFVSCDSKHRSLFANAYSNTHEFINYGMCKFVHRINIFEIKITLKLGSLDQILAFSFSRKLPFLLNSMYFSNSYQI